MDDAPLIRNVARIVLEREGYFVLSAANGEEALYLSRTFPVRIHLLLSDVKMPRMDGWQLRERVMEERPGTKVLLMSAQVEMPPEQAFLRKPFGPNALKKRVREMLHREKAAVKNGLTFGSNISLRNPLSSGRCKRRAVAPRTPLPSP